MHRSEVVLTSLRSSAIWAEVAETELVPNARERQVAKGVNQLAMGLADAACLEALAFGVRAGIDPEALAQAIGGDEGWRGCFAHLARRVSDGTAEQCWVKFPELLYFLAESADPGQPMPLTEALHAFLAAGDVSCHDNMGHPTASCWRELMTRQREL